MLSTVSAEAGSCLLVNSLLTEEMVNRVSTKDIENEKGVLNIVELVCLVALETIKAINERNFRFFDSNPADDACQSRAAILCQLSKLDFSSECEHLVRETSRLRQDVRERRSVLGRGGSGASYKIFQDACKSLRVSPNLEYLFHARILTILRKTQSYTKEGIALTRTDMTGLQKLTKHADKIDGEIRRHMITHLQNEHAAQSIRLMGQLTSDSLAREMTTPENVMVYSPSARYKPRSFSCHYFEVLTLLDMIEKERLHVVLRIHKEKGKAPYNIVVRDDRPHEGGVQKGPCIYIDAAAKGTKEQILVELKKHGFRRCMQSQAAKAPPFHPKSTLADIRNEEARRLIEAMASEELLTSAVIDHIYFDEVKVTEEGV